MAGPNGLSSDEPPRRRGSGATRSIARVVCSLIAAVALIGCTDGNDDSAGGSSHGIVAVAAREYAYDLPSEIPAGSVSFELTNQGEMPHEFGLLQLEEEASSEELQFLLGSDQGLPEGISHVAGASVLSPGLSARMTTDLEPGPYALYCYLPTPSGAPHVDQGMIATFEAGPDEVDVPAPDPDLTVSFDDDGGYEIPEVEAGRQVVEFRNDRADLPHTFQLVSYGPDQTKEDVTAWLAGRLDGPAPAIFPGGAREVAPGGSLIMEIEFRSGRTYTLDDPVGASDAEIVVD